MKIDQNVQEIWSGHDSVTDGQTDEGHSYNPLPLRVGGHNVNAHTVFAIRKVRHNSRIEVSLGCTCIYEKAPLILIVLLLYVPSQQLWLWRDGQFIYPQFFPGQA